MFFIGGFSSIIPYLLYLSLVWIFLLIGCYGRIVRLPFNEETKASFTTGKAVSAEAETILWLSENSVTSINKTIIADSPFYNRYSDLPFEECTAPLAAPLFISFLQQSSFLRGPPTCLT